MYGNRTIDRMHSDVSDTAWKQTAMSSGLEVRNKIWHNHFVVIATKIEDQILNQVYEDLENDEY
jgi:hypothetical protein